jgi:hypothetical protein
MLYFVQTARFSPNTFERLGFVKIEIDDEQIFMYTKDKSFWKRRDLLDIGWGKEHGLVRTPELAFEQLIPLVLTEYTGKECEETYNLWGALAVLIDDYCLEFLEFIMKTFSKDDLLLKHKFVYDHLKTELGFDDNFLRKLGDEKFTECCHKWRQYING